MTALFYVWATDEPTNGLRILWVEGDKRRLDRAASVAFPEGAVFRFNKSIRPEPELPDAWVEAAICTWVTDIDDDEPYDDPREAAREQADYRRMTE